MTNQTKTADNANKIVDIGSRLARGKTYLVENVEGKCQEPRLCLSQLNDGIDRQRVPLQDEDHSGSRPQSFPGFPRLCSGMFPERFRSASVFVGSREIRLI